jgi:hypothetical protein
MKMVPLTNGGWRIPKETLWARKIAKRSKVVCRVVASCSKKKKMVATMNKANNKVKDPDLRNVNMCISS